jgi:hypothetical protein
MTTEIAKTTTTEIAEAQKTSSIFQSFTTGRAIAPGVQDKCTEYMTALREEISKNRAKYLDYNIRFTSRKRDVVRNALSQHVIDVYFLVHDARRRFPYQVKSAVIYAIYTERNEFCYVVRKEIGHQIGAANMPEEAFAYLTDTVNIPAAAPELIGSELRDLQRYVWYGNKKATEGRGYRDVVLKHVKRVQDTSFSALGNVTIGLAAHFLRKREARTPL